MICGFQCLCGSACQSASEKEQFQARSWWLMVAMFLEEKRWFLSPDGALKQSAQVRMLLGALIHFLHARTHT